jgi:hypothetical protein
MTTTQKIIFTPEAPQVATANASQNREQVKTLLAACRVALNDINTARRHAYTGSAANPNDMTFDAIENTLEPSTRELHTAIASVESEGQ